MAIEWNEASTKFKVAWFSWLIGAPIISVVLYRMQIPYLEVYLIVIAIAAWTAAILHKRRRAGSVAEESDDQSREDNSHG